MKTKTLRISVIAMFAAILTLGISSCSGGGQGNQDRGSQQTHGRSHDMDVSDARLAEFRVNGNCSMCKQRIEEAATSVGGVNSAEWNVQTKMVEITLEQGTDLHEVHMAIAKAGHDTEMHKATDEAYDNLHACCKYERE
jgi:periplasmic mercuric ion binding protein